MFQIFLLISYLNFLSYTCLMTHIALMSFDNYPFPMIVQPTLTAIEVDMYEMGWQAARFMLQMIKKPNLQTQSFCTTPTIIEREYT